MAVGCEFHMGIIAGFERDILPSAPSVRRTQKRVIDRCFKNARIRPNDVVIVVDDDAVAPPQGLLAFKYHVSRTSSSPGEWRLRQRRWWRQAGAHRARQKLPAEDGLIADEVALLDVAQRVEPIAGIGRANASGGLPNNEHLTRGVPRQCGGLAAAHAPDGGDALDHVGALVQGEHSVFGSDGPKSSIQRRSAMHQFLGLVVGEVVGPRSDGSVS